MTIGQQVRELRAARGLTQAELGRRVGVSQQTIDALESGRTDRSRHLPEIARELGVTVEALKDATGTEAEPAARVDSSRRPELRHEPPRIAASDLPKDVPVLGQAVGGDSADFEFNGQTIDYLRRPPGLAMMREVFGLYVTGSSMWPRFEEGEPIYVSAARPPAIGDYVVVELHPTHEGESGAGYVKRLKQRTGSKIVCEQFNPPKDIEFEREHVKALFRIIPLIELVGT